jgi:glycosyltransferase involved in cell wall biosynthesis
MRVLLVHNYYQQAGGEDQVFRAEEALLRAHGHAVKTYTVSNNEIDARPRAQVAAETLWNRREAAAVGQAARQHGAEVVHFHNTFPIISPAAYGAARRAGSAVVQTLHNFRLVCASALLYRDGHVCEACLGKTVPWPAVQHACYRGSRSGSAVVAALQVTQRALGRMPHGPARRGTDGRGVDTYIALTDFARDKLAQGGLPVERIMVKPNFLAQDPGVGQGDGGYALFVGRLSPEKGIETLLEAWRTLGDRVPLRIVGDGPLAPQVAQAAASLPGVTWLGRQDQAQVEAQMKGAAALILPSGCYEGFPVTLVEAYAVGLPVIGSDLGAMAALIEHGETGLLFTPGVPEALVAQVQWLWSHETERRQLSLRARERYLSTYTASQNHDALLGIYLAARQRRQQRLRRATEAPAETA